MKKLLLSILLFSCLRLFAQSQQAGISFGITQSNIQAENFSKGNKPRTGITMGINYQYSFKNHFTISAGAFYDQRGFSLETIFTDETGNPTGGKSRDSYNYNYLSVPLCFGYQSGKKLFCFAKAGLVPSLLLNANQKTPSIKTNTIDIPEHNYTVTDAVTKFDLAGAIEAGGGYHMANRLYLQISGSYRHSFTTITNAIYFGESIIRFHAIGVSMGIVYSI